LLFAAGREATEAFSAEPDEEFVSDARARLLGAAGAPAQEALRSVPPPRLPFWVNARRRLLEHASAPRVRPAPRAGTLALQRGLSFAVLIIAVAVAGIAYITSDGQPQSVNAELASLEQDLIEVEAQAAAGEIVSPSVLIDLSKRTTDLVERIDEPSPLVAQKLPDIIERQKEVVTLVAGDGLAPAQLREAQQELTQAEAMVKVLTAQIESSPTPVPPLFQPTLPALSSPTASATPSTPPSGLASDQVSIQPLPTDTLFGIAWSEVRTTGIRFVVPSSWKVVGVSLTDGIGTLDDKLLRFDGPDFIVIIDVSNGEINALVDGQPVQLRSKGEDGDVISIPALLNISTSLAPSLFHHADSVELMDGSATPAAPPTASPSPTATPSPTPTATNTVVP
jgi:hypothetical protein